jgi:hypothetical protein
MITFRVAKEQFGWAVQMDQRMTTPFRTRDLAVREAQMLAGALRAHGQLAEVVIDDMALSDVNLSAGRAPGVIALQASC